MDKILLIHQVIKLENANSFFLKFQSQFFLLLMEVDEKTVFDETNKSIVFKNFSKRIFAEMNRAAYKKLQNNLDSL